MVIETLFGPEEIPEKPRVIKFKQIRAVYETLTVKEEVAGYFHPLTRYTHPEQVFRVFSFLQQETKEYFLTVHLDGKNRILAVEILSVGSLNQSIVSPRELYKTALLSSAAAVVLIHNHPTGDPTPSREDIEITKRLVAAGELLAIRVIDHIIIGDRFLSFAEQGML